MFGFCVSVHCFCFVDFYFVCFSSANYLLCSVFCFCCSTLLSFHSHENPLSSSILNRMHYPVHAQGTLIFVLFPNFRFINQKGLIIVLFGAVIVIPAVVVLVFFVVSVRISSLSSSSSVSSSSVTSSSQSLLQHPLRRHRCSRRARFLSSSSQWSSSP